MKYIGLCCLKFHYVAFSPIKRESWHKLLQLLFNVKKSDHGNINNSNNNNSNNPAAHITLWVWIVPWPGYYWQEKPLENKINIQILISLGRLAILCGPHIQENSERMPFPGGAGGAWIRVIVLNSEFSSPRLVSFALVEFLKTGLYHMQTTCFLGKNVVCETLTLRITFVDSSFLLI